MTILRSVSLSLRTSQPRVMSPGLGRGEDPLGADWRRRLVPWPCHRSSRCPLFAGAPRITPSSVTRDHRAKGMTHEDRGHRRERLIGSKLVNKLGELRHDAMAASPDSGVDTLTGDGLDEAI